MDSDQRVDKNIQAVAKEIQNYLRKHPHAADSAEGVMRWWLSQQRFEECVNIVQQALEWLVAKGDINKAITPGCQTIYFNAADESDEKLSAESVN